jgi:hypothetical protein
MHTSIVGEPNAGLLYGAGRNCVSGSNRTHVFERAQRVREHDIAFGDELVAADLFSIGSGSGTFAMTFHGRTSFPSVPHLVLGPKTVLLVGRKRAISAAR